MNPRPALLQSTLRLLPSGCSVEPMRCKGLKYGASFGTFEIRQQVTACIQHGTLHPRAPAPRPPYSLCFTAKAANAPAAWPICSTTAAGVWEPFMMLDPPRRFSKSHNRPLACPQVSTRTRGTPYEGTGRKWRSGNESAFQYSGYGRWSTG
ncbi:MAG: hypothetical protein ACLUVY_05590 [Bacteroides uniformis]